MSKVINKDMESLLTEFIQVRDMTMNIFNPLNIEDAVIQSDDFGSPPNWHIAHVTWFFHKIISKYYKDISMKDLNLEYLNSYYQKFKNILPKNQRGKYPRPTVEQSKQYRSWIDRQISIFLKKIEVSEQLTDELLYDLHLANQHEMQHQELMIYDFQNYFSRFSDPNDNYKPFRINNPEKEENKKHIKYMIEIPGGIYELGFNKKSFCYDNELPEHKVYLYPYKIDSTLVTNRDFINFIENGGYTSYRYWLSDGWDLVLQNNWNCPLYWFKKNDLWMKKDFFGIREIDPDEPVINISYYEADAYCRWKNKRLPTEAEWEKAASWNDDLKIKTIYPWGNELPSLQNSNLLESFLWRPTKVGMYENGKSYYGCYQMIGDVWEWTSSEYSLYPGFKSKFSEYTDKWSINQKVLKGGSFATPAKQIRNSYRNYFKPHERILFAGFRCAKTI
ncbi:MAG: ergothioneine biosynthesis protein EgtB [Nitrososphaeraceae archaeon]